MIHLTFIIAGQMPKAPPPSTYVDAAKRFAESYSQFPAGEDHELILVDSHGGYTPEIQNIFEGISHKVVPYAGLGWDIGAHLHVASQLPSSDWIMCFSSWGHFRRGGWLSAFESARQVHGDGLYGSTASWEHSRHIRGTGFFIRCGLLHEYPVAVNSREESFSFEVGPKSLTEWCLKNKYGVWVVMPEKTVSLRRAEFLKNGFRQGDQTNIWTFDKHTDLFEKGTLQEQKELTLRSYPSTNTVVGNGRRLLSCLLDN